MAKVIKGFVAENGYFHSYIVFLYKGVYSISSIGCKKPFRSKL